MVKASNGRYGATHAATESGELACGTRPQQERAPSQKRQHRARRHDLPPLPRPNSASTSTGDSQRAAGALFVLAITLGLRPGELRKLTWDHVDLDQGMIHVWRSASKSGDTKTPQSKRSLILPKRAIDALTAHKKRQAAERLARRGLAGHTTSSSATRTATQYTTDALNWRFGKMTRRRASATGTPTRAVTPPSRS